jgi:hypothetical protein
MPPESVVSAPGRCETDRSSPRVPTEGWFALLLLVAALWAALTVDPIRSGWGIKGDEATFTAMAMSAAFDGDLAYERKDLLRFWAVYECGPDGIFLKRGRRLHLSFDSRPPFVRITRSADTRDDRLYFGKAFIHAIMAAPFVRVLGLNGLLVMNVLLLAGACFCAYRFAAARAPGPAAMAIAFAFFGASIVPIYLVWHTPEIFNLSFVSFAFFLWLYKEVAPAAPGRLAAFLRGPGSDVLGAVALGMATFSKPLNLLLIAPIIALLWWRRRWWRGLVVGAVFVATVGGLFSGNAAISGEFNYQGSDVANGDNRRSFYGTYPFAYPGAKFETGSGGATMVTNEAPVDLLFERGVFLPRLARNTYYFLLGRHSGFVPYFFPGLVVLILWLLKPREIARWQVLALLGVVASSLGLLLQQPYSWSGGGGPVGNRYFLNYYPVLFFLVPPLGSVRPGLVSWAGGMLFVAQALVNPFQVAKQPWLVADQGIVRMLPVELTMVNDLPINLIQGAERYRCGLRVGSDPTLTLFLLDENIYAPESAGLWVHGERRADVIVRSPVPLATLRLQLSSAVPNTAAVHFGGRRLSVDLKPGEPVEVRAAADAGVYADGAYGYMLSIGSSSGFVPVNTLTGSSDTRFLGVLMQLQGMPRK